jgi:hypothetical protein
MLITPLVLILSVGLIFSNFNLIEFANAEKTPQKTSSLCQSIYKSYKKLGTTEFIRTFSDKPYLNDCLKLYTDSKWTFKGKYEIDQAYKKLKQEKDQLKESTKGKASVTSKAKIGEGKFVFKFSVCVNKGSLQKPLILLQSDKEKFIGVVEIPVHQNQCKEFYTQIKASDPNTIKSTLLENQEIPKGISVRPIKYT